MDDKPLHSSAHLAKVVPPSWIPLITGNGRIRKRQAMDDDWRITASYLVMNPTGWAELGSPPRVVLFQVGRDLHIVRGDGLPIEEAPGSGAPAIRLSQRRYLRQLLLPGIYLGRVESIRGMRTAIYPAACFTNFLGRQDFAIFLKRTTTESNRE